MLCIRCSLSHTSMQWSLLYSFGFVLLYAQIRLLTLPNRISVCVCVPCSIPLAFNYCRIGRCSLVRVCAPMYWLCKKSLSRSMRVNMCACICKRAVVRMVRSSLYADWIFRWFFREVEPLCQTSFSSEATVQPTRRTCPVSKANLFRSPIAYFVLLFLSTADSILIFQRNSRSLNFELFDRITAISNKEKNMKTVVLINCELSKRD